MRVRLLLLCLSPSLGGLELHVRDYARWLAAQPGVELWLGLRRGSRLAAALADLPAPRYETIDRTSKLPLAAALRLARFIRANGIQLVHAHDQRELPLASIAQRLAPHSGMVFTRHMALGGAKRDPYHRAIYGALDRYVAVSDWIAADSVRKLPLDPARIVRIYPGTPAVPALATEQHEVFTVGMVGRILPDKGQHLLIEAAARLKTQGHRVRVLLAGEIQDPGYFEALRRTAQDAGLDWQHLGFVSPPAEAFRQFDAAVCAGRDEAFGLSTVEAMRHGLPVVAARSGAAPEIVEDGVSGLLFDAGDAAGLAVKLETLLHDPALRQRLGQAGRERAEREFDAECQFAKLLAISRETLS
ncbi:MAG TPA: glycosyltransferase family 4 protein [Solimonas sp.]|nr:glycosyltransferase family 4 protein [Solimonas sp.]